MSSKILRRTSFQLTFGSLLIHLVDQKESEEPNISYHFVSFLVEHFLLKKSFCLCIFTMPKELENDI